MRRLKWIVAGAWSSSGGGDRYSGLDGTGGLDGSVGVGVGVGVADRRGAGENVGSLGVGSWTCLGVGARFGAATGFGVGDLVMVRGRCS